MALKALFLNCTLKKSPEPSNTEALMRESAAIFQAEGFATEMVRFVDHPIGVGVEKDMGPGDAWPAVFDKVMAAQAVVIGSPIWLGNPSSACIQLLERLYAHSSDTNDVGQYIYYNKVGGCVVTGNDDGASSSPPACSSACSTSASPSRRRPTATGPGEAGPGPSTSRRAATRSRARRCGS
jgi:multimeric flavodoxin WrbA